MKKSILRLCLMLTVSTAATACAKAAPYGAYRSKTAEAAPSGTAAALGSKASLYAKGSAKQQKQKRMFVYEGDLYIDTGETSTAGRCGVMDGTIEKTVAASKIPTQELQSNFGKGYGFQIGRRKNRLEVCIDGTWHIFAHNENNFEGVSMKVKRHTAKSAVLTIATTVQRDVIFGEEFLLEKKDAKTGEWEALPYKASDFGFNDIGYLAQKDAPAKWKVDWSWLYGTLKPGTYRIVKELGDLRDGAKTEFYTLSAKFRVEP